MECNGMYLGFWHGGTLTLELSHLLSSEENTSIHLLSSWQTLLWFNFDYSKLLKTGDGRPWEKLIWTASFCRPHSRAFPASSIWLLAVCKNGVRRYKDISILFLWNSHFMLTNDNPNHISVTTCDTCAVDHMVRFTRPSPSIFAYCKRPKTGGREGLATRLDRMGSMHCSPCHLHWRLLLMRLSKYTLTMLGN